MISYPFQAVSDSEKETAELAVKFAQSLKGGEVIVLNGNLGSGKTFFIKKVCLQFGIDEVVSPTFAIVNEHNGKFHINHFDFYRINKVHEIYDLGFEEYISSPDTITFIEWGDLFKEVLPKKRIEINIKFISDKSREFRFSLYE